MYYRISNGTAAAAATSLVRNLYLNKYHYSPDPFYSTHMAYIVPKGSPLQVEQKLVASRSTIFLTTTNRSNRNGFQEKFRHSIMWLRDTGALERMKNIIMRPPELILDPKVRRDQPLILRQLGLIMIVQVIGLLLGTIIFLMEVLKKAKEKSVPKTDNGIEMKTPCNHHPARAHEIVTEIMDN